MRNAMRVLIVDDEAIARRGIRQLLAAHDDVEIAGEARSGKEAVRLVQTLRPDLMFLDVQMPEGDGFSVLARIAAGALPAIVFVTAYDEFAVRAFEAHALDYLLKPVHKARFDDALERGREFLRVRNVADLSRRLSLLLEEVEARPARRPTTKLLIPATNGEIVVDVAAIRWIEAEDYYAAIHIGAERHFVRESLDSLEARLGRADFVRVHRGAIVNLRHVSKVHNGDLVLRDGARVRISRRRRRALEEALRRFAR
jgi:two-component system, LytTR family, response regulator